MTKIIAFILLMFVFSECAPRQVRQINRKKNCPPLPISQTKETMTAKQFWNLTFPGNKTTIFEVMEGFADQREAEVKKKCEDKLHVAEAARVEAQTNVKTLLRQYADLQKEFKEYRQKASESFADGDL